MKPEAPGGSSATGSPLTAVGAGSDVVGAGPEDSLERLLRLALRHLEVPAALVSARGPDGPLVQVGLGLDVDAAGSESPTGPQALGERTAAGDDPVILSALSAGEGEVRAWAGIPLRARSGAVTGCFAVMDREPRRWTGRELDLLAGLAGAAVSEIELRLELSARHAAQAQQAATARFLRGTLESLDGAVFVVNKGGQIIVECNHAAELVFGYSRQELLGSPTARLHVDVDHHDRFGDLSVAVLRTEGTYRGDFQMKRADGSVFPTRHVVRLLEPERGLDSPVVSIVYDRSDEVEAQRRLEASEERFRQIAESIDDVFWIYSVADDRMEYVSPAYRAIWGRDPAELADEPRGWTRAIHEDDRGRVLEALPRRAQGSFDEEYRVVRPGGDVRWIWDRAFPLLDGGGRVYRIIGVARDVTERRRLREQLQQSQKLEAVGRLAGGVAHDFNNLLTVIKGHAELALDELGAEAEVAADLVKIADTAQHGTRLIRQLLAFGRKQYMEERVLDLRDTVAELEDMVRRLVRREVEMDFDVAGEPLEVKADPTQIAQVVLNLVVNAADAIAGRGRIRVVVEPGALSIDDAEAVPWQARAGPYAAVVVTDTGAGMSDDVLEQIFEPFFTTKDEGEGTGLGLSMVYGIVKQSKGHIFVESEPGKGTTFRVLFPRTKDTDA